MTSRTGARRYGDDYQDLVTIEAMLEILENPANYSHIEMEVPDVGQLDDIALYARDKQSCRFFQIKYSLYAENDDDCYSWDKLLCREETKKGKKLPSLLGHWIQSFETCMQKNLSSFFAELRTNRKFDETLNSVFDPKSKKIDFRNLPEDILSKLQEEGFSVDQLRNFFDNFIFNINYLEFDTLAECLTQRLATLGCPRSSFLSLKDALREWIRNRVTPIDLFKIRTACEWHQLNKFDEEFVRPGDYIAPPQGFNNEVFSHLSKSGECLLLEAGPGVGKSCYISFLRDYYIKQNKAFIRHHYFLALDQSVDTRINHREILESLMAEMRGLCMDALRKVSHKNSTYKDFPNWYAACANHYKDNPLIIAIDGLDHVWRAQHNMDEVNKLLGHLFPIPQGISLIIGSQPLHESYAPTHFMRYAGSLCRIELPRWSRDNIADWLSTNDIIRQEPIHGLGELISSLFSASGGHPLLARYIMQGAMDGEDKINLYSITHKINSFFQCETPKSLNDYYDFIVGKISNCARYMLEAIVASCWPWPESSLIDFTVQNGYSKETAEEAWYSIQHLLKENFLGWQLIHESFLLYLRRRFPKASDNCNKALIAWLESTDLEYWRWRYWPNFSASESILNKKWCIDSYASGYLTDEISLLLNQSATRALQTGNIEAFASQTLWCDYVANKYNLYDTSRLGQYWAELQLLLANSQYIPLIQLHNKTTIANCQLHALILYFRSDERILDILDKELIDRDQIACNTQTHSMDNNLCELEHILIETIGIRRTSIKPQLIEFLNKNDDHRNRAIKYLWIHQKNDFIRNILSSSLASEETKLVCSKYLTLAALEKGFDYSCCKGFISNSYSTLYERIVSTNNKSITGFTAKPASTIPTCRYGDTDIFENWLLDVLFFILANTGREDALVEKFLKTMEPQETWRYHFLSIFFRRLKRISYNDNATSLLKNICNTFVDVDMPDRDSNEISAWQALFRVLPEFLIQVKIILTSESKDFHFSQEELASILDVRFCYAENWTEQYLSYHRSFLSGDALDYLTGRISALPFENTGENGKQTAILALLFAREARYEDAMIFFKKSIDQFLAYGYHKDAFFYTYIKAGHFFAPKQVVELFSSLFKGACEIRNYTEDCNDTKEFASLLAEKWPSAISEFYDYFFDHRSYFDAESVFNLLCLNLPLDTEIQKALARTNLSSDFLAEIKKREQKEPKKHIAASLYIEHSKRKIHQNPEDSFRGMRQESQIYSVKDYPPEKLGELLQTIADSFSSSFESYLDKWCEFWEKQTSIQIVLRSLKNCYGRYYCLGSHHLPLTIFNYTKRLEGNDVAWTWLIKYFKDIRGWSSYSTDLANAQIAWQIIKDIYPTRWLQFMQDTMIDSTGAQLSMWGKVERFAQYLLFMNQEAMAIGLMRGNKEVLEGLLTPFGIDVTPYAKTQCDPNSRYAQLLVKRLEWPSGLVREQACRELSLLLQDNGQAQVQMELLRWIKEQRLDSLAQLGLLPFLLLKKRCANFSITQPIERDYPCSIAFTEMLSLLAASSVVPSATFPLAPSDYHPPADFITKYTPYLPEIYKINAINVSQNTPFNFSAQWAYEFSKLDSIENDIGGSYWGSDHSEHLTVMDLITSEKMRTAYLYTLCCLCQNFPASYEMAKFCSLKTIPIDVGLWTLSPRTEPFPLFTVSTSTASPIDMVPGEVGTMIENLIANSTKEENLVAAASGRIQGSNTIYDLEIRGFMQKAKTPSHPEPQELFESMEYYAQAGQVTGSIDFTTDSIRQEKFHEDSYIAGWEVLPLFSKINFATVPRWQYWRIQRKIHVPYLKIISQEVLLPRLEENQLVYYTASNKAIGYFYDWTNGLSERTDSNLTPDCGNILFIAKDALSEMFKQRYSYCLVYKLTSFTRKHEYGDFDLNSFWGYKGCSPIIIP